MGRRLTRQIQKFQAVIITPSTMPTQCVVCRISSAQYTCPRCNQKTCSLKCSKRHKEQSGCSGERDLTGYVSRSRLRSSATTFDSDYNLLMAVEREIRLRHASFRDNGSVPKHIEKLRNLLHKHGYSISYTPLGLYRSRLNKTQFHTKRQCILWTIEWCFHTDLTTESKISHWNDEGATLTDCFSRLKIAALNWPIFSLRNPNDVADTPSYRSLDTQAAVRDSLLHATIIDFPCIDVFTTVRSNVACYS